MYMKMYKQKFNRGKGSVNNIPNAIAYTFIRNYMNSKEFEEIAHILWGIPHLLVQRR